jgi:hypothetical protein
MMLLLLCAAACCCVVVETTVPDNAAVPSLSLSLPRADAVITAVAAATTVVTVAAAAVDDADQSLITSYMDARYGCSMRMLSIRRWCHSLFRDAHTLVDETNVTQTLLCALNVTCDANTSVFLR